MKTCDHNKYIKVYNFEGFKGNSKIMDIALLPSVKNGNSPENIEIFCKKCKRVLVPRVVNLSRGEELSKYVL